MQPAPSGRIPTHPVPAPAPIHPAPVLRPSPSGRAPAARPSAKSIGAAEIAAAPRASGRRAASPVPGRGGSRASGRERGGHVKKKVRGGPELLIAAGVIVLLAVASGIMYVVRSNERKAANATLEKRDEILKRNWKRALDAFDKADAAGRLYVMGKEEFSDKLITPFKGDSDIFNVIYERRYKDKKAASQTDVKSVDETRLKLYPMSSPNRAEGEIQMVYGFGDSEKKVPIVIASKNIKSAEGDNTNQGGKITVVVRADEDDNFEKARHYKPPEPEKKPAVDASKKG